jgi:hypothetical protein
MEDAMSAGAAGGAAAAATAAALTVQQEEEEMTPYGARELAEDWEFKILRSATNGFRDPVWLNAILQEEARAGWMLVEKFDDGRVRLKRSPAAHAKDGSLGFDAYRTWVGMSQQRLAVVILVAIFGGLATVGIIVGAIIWFVQAGGMQ